MNEMEELEQLLDKRDKINDRILALGDRKKEIESRIKAILGRPQKVTLGKHYISWSETVSRRIDTKKIKAEIPEIVEKYMIESKSERLTITIRKPK